MKTDIKKYLHAGHLSILSTGVLGEKDKCYYCCAIGKTTKDHFYPSSLGGVLKVHACKKCNEQKANKTPLEWVAYLKNTINEIPNIPINEFILKKLTYSIRKTINLWNRIKWSVEDKQNITKGTQFIIGKGDGSKTTIVIGHKYKGMGFSGMSDGVEITGRLTHYYPQFDEATLQDLSGIIHAVIPTTLEPLIKNAEILPETENLKQIIKKLIETAKLSTCKRSKCGSAIVIKKTKIIGKGYNSMPQNHIGECFKDNLPAGFKSDRTCCIHAEQRAIMNALTSKYRSALDGSTLYFLRLDENDNPIHAGEPYCTICSKMALDVGISKFVLWHKQGWTAYNTKYYNELSFKHNGKS